MAEHTGKIDITEEELLEIARSAGMSFERIKTPAGFYIWTLTYDDETTEDFTFEQAAIIVSMEFAKLPPTGWNSYLRSLKGDEAEKAGALFESVFGPWPPLRIEEVQTPTGTAWEPIPIEEGGFDWDAFESFNEWIIQQEGRIVEAPKYFTGDNAWKEADVAARAATEESGGKQEWEVVGVAAREPTYYIRPVDTDLPPERLLGTTTIKGGQIEYTYGYTDAQGNTKITKYEYSEAPGAPAATYLGIRTKIGPDGKTYTFHATGYPDKDAEGSVGYPGEAYTRIDLIPEEDPTYKFLGKQLVDGEWYYAYGHDDPDDPGNPVIIDAAPVDPTETLLYTEKGVEYWGNKDEVTGEETITRTEVAPVPRDPTQEHFGRGTDDKGREYDIYGYWDPTTGRKVITGRQYLEDIEPDEVFLGTVDDGGWRIDQYGYIDPETRRPVVTRRQSREPIRDPILSVDEMIAQALGKVDDWSDLGDPNLQRAQSLFDFKRQPTDAERLRLAMDLAQSPSDYMTLVGLYTGAISRESPARAGERIAPLAPYLQQMAQKFFLDVPGINEMAPRRQPTQPTQPAAAAPSVTPTTAAPSVIPAAAITAPSLGDVTTTPDFGFDPATATSSLPLYYQQLNQSPDTEVFEPPAIDIPISSDDLSADPAFLEKMYGGKYPVATGVAQGTYPSNKHLMLPTFQQGGIVPGPIGAPKIIQAHGGERVIPNPIQGSGMLPEYGVWRPPSREFSRQVVKPGTKGLIPSTKESAIRFRSPQTIRYMTPSQRMLFQEDVERTFNVPYEDWRMQEMLSTGVGAPRGPRIQFRRPSFVRG